MRTTAKATLAAGLSWSGIAAALARRRSDRPLILGYHRVVERVAAVDADVLPGMTISQATLRAHLEWVARRYRIVSLDEIGSLLERGVPCGNLAAVTFDDGYLDVYEHALPVLEQLGVPGAVFVVSGLVGTDELPIHDELYEIVKGSREMGRPMPPSLRAALRACGQRIGGGSSTAIATVRALLALPPEELRAIIRDVRAMGWHSVAPRELRTMDWTALSAMERAGITVGSHTHTHAMLDLEDDHALTDELVRSRAVLEHGLGHPVQHLAYPDGRFDDRVAAAVRAAGYRFAYAICDHSLPADPLMAIPRVMLWERSCSGLWGRFSPSMMECHAASVLPIFHRCDDDHVTAHRVEP